MMLGVLSFEWMSGRMLETVHKNSNTITMVYDSDGMRTHKNTVTYEYDSDKKLISMTKGNDTLLFYYDTDGNPIAVKKGNNIYYYIRNLQGDIVKIVNKLDRAIVNYEYDEWGRILSITNRQGTPITSDTNIGLLNPFRYRGYVYDDETGLYYLQSRYYDPVTGRFINADVYCDTQSDSPLSTNMFAYCENSVLNRIDFNGYKPVEYFTINASVFNCYSYALGYSDRWLSPGYRGFDRSYIEQIYTNRVAWTVTKKANVFILSDKPSLEMVTNQVILDLRYLKIGYRTVKKDTKLNKGEYRIAYHVVAYDAYYDSPSGVSTKHSLYGFHFMKQNPYTNEWWTKHGSANIQNLGIINPDVSSSWYVPLGNKLNKKNYGYFYNSRTKTYEKRYLYYNSTTKYIAVKNKFWSL